MIRSSFVLHRLGILCLFFFGAFSFFGQGAKPNIVYILADDLGYGDVSAYQANGKIKTPNIDRLAKQGVQFLDAHAPSGVCTPTRYGILTGRSPFRSALPVGVLRGYSRALLDDKHPSVASVLRGVGYRTGVVGKWHLGMNWQVLPGKEPSISWPKDGSPAELDPNIIDFSKPVQQGPNDHGFSYSYVLPASLDMPPYVYLENQKVEELPSAYTKGNKEDVGYAGPFWREGLMAPSFNFQEVLPQFVAKARAFISQKEARPFFLYLPLAAPHTPWVPKPDYQASSGAGAYGDFVQQVDAAVGQILDHLDALGLSKHTIVIFTSDNGPYWRPDYIERFQHRSAGPWRGMKGDAYEGGHRVPFLLRWPGVVKPNSQSHASISLSDLMATVADMHGLPLQTEDSYSLLPILRGDKKQGHRRPLVFTSSIGYLTIRFENWKLINGLGSGGFTDPKQLPEKAGGPKGQLFDLESDPAERHDLYLQRPDKVAELERLLQEVQAGKRFE